MSAAVEICRHLRGKRSGSGYVARCPCHDDRTPSFSFRDGATTLLVKCFAGCDPRDILRELSRRGLYNASSGGSRRAAARGTAAPTRLIDDTEERRAGELWDECTADARGTRVEAYFNVRQLELTDDLVGRVVRYHLDFPSREDGQLLFVPAMVMPFRDIFTDVIVGVQATFLTADGLKIQRKTRGRRRNAAIKIDDNADVTEGVVIAAGFETAIAGRQLGYRPVWALGGDDGISNFPVLEGIDGLSIHTENDANGRNQQAVAACSERWFSSEREVILVEPLIGKDVNDAIRWRAS
jgi:Toprim domain/CHC2 zinc finger